MLTFPRLAFGSVVQYPAGNTTSFSNQVLSFVDGSEQRYRTAAPLRRWVIQLELLAEAELNALEQFFSLTQGSFDTFAFPDPFSTVTYPSCYLANDRLESIYLSSLHGKTSLVVCESGGA